MYILCTLVRNLEEGFTISPDSGPLEGKLRLIGVGDVGAEEVVRIMGLAYKGGEHVKDEVVVYEEVEGMRIEFEDDEEEEGVEDSGRWRRICVDGTVVECPKGGWVEVRRDRGREVVDLVAV